MSSHHHSHHKHSNIATNNAEYFDKSAGEYDNKYKKMSQEMCAALAAELSKLEFLDLGNARALDYACGTGNISQVLAPLVSEIVGLDISQGMIERFNKKNIATKDGKAVKGFVADLFEDPETKIEGVDLDNFDFGICSMAFHHMSDPAGVLKALSDHLKGSGYFAVVDRQVGKLADGRDFHHLDHHVAHSGFSEEKMKVMFKSAGFEMVSFSHIYTARMKINRKVADGEEDPGQEEEGTWEIFLTVGKKI